MSENLSPIHQILSEKFSSKNLKLYKELEIVQTAQLNQLFELLHLVHIIIRPRLL